MAFIRYVPEAELDPADRVADPDYIIQVHAVHPAVMRQHYDLYVELMRRPGFDDRAIHDLCAVVAYFNFVNRIADGLGVELENG